MRVLLIEDDSATAQSIELMLKSENFNVYTTDLGEEGIDLGKLYDYDIILLDLNLPDMSGYEVLRTLRVAKVKTPILILSGLAGIEDKVKGLGFGADDYLTKPFHKDELVARIHAIVRRSKGHAQSVITTGDLVVNLDQKTVEVSGARVHLTGKEYQMLELLSLRKGTTLTKEMFLNHLYGGMDEPELKIIDVFICKLRKKLGERIERPQLHRDGLGPRLCAARAERGRRAHHRLNFPGCPEPSMPARPPSGPLRLRVFGRDRPGLGSARTRLTLREQRWVSCEGLERVRQADDRLRRTEQQHAVGRKHPGQPAENEAAARDIHVHQNIAAADDIEGAERSHIVQQVSLRKSDGLAQGGADLPAGIDPSEMTQEQAGRQATLHFEMRVDAGPRHVDRHARDIGRDDID